MPRNDAAVHAQRCFNAPQFDPHAHTARAILWRAHDVLARAQLRRAETAQRAFDRIGAQRCGRMRS
eukprot:2462321-Lingulodinium_polyedra.AAC.1